MKKILILVTMIFLIVSCWKNEEEVVKKNYKSILVGSWNVLLNNSFVWYAKWVEQVSLSTKAPWRIIFMAKNIWDKVYKWELLASLDWAEAEVWYNTAYWIETSLVRLKNATVKALDWQIKSMKLKIEGIKAWAKWVTTWLENTKIITNNQIQTAKVWLETAQLNLEETKNLFTTKKSNIISWSKTAITQSIIIDENIIDFIDKLLWITKINKSFNDDFEDYLWIKNSTQFAETKTIFLEAKIVYDEYKKYFEENIEDKKINEEVLIIWLEKAEKVWEKLKKLLNNTYTVINNSIVNIHFTSTQISTYQNNISTYWTNLENSLLSMSWDTMIWIKWSLENLKNFESEKNKAISILEKQVSFAEKTLTQYKSMWVWEVNNIETKKQVTDLWLEEAIKWLEALISQKEATLREIETKIIEAKWNKNTAWVMINNWKIYSTFWWIVTKKYSEVWQVINAWMPIYEIANTNNIKVLFWVNEDIVNKLTIWDKLDLSIKNSIKIYKWEIISLSESKNPITKKFDIEVIINNSKKEISTWSMITLNFQNEVVSNSEESKIIIPTSAIIEKYMIPGIYKINEWKVQFQNIKIINFGQDFSQIEWIENWDEIITEWKENLWDGEEL